MSYGVVRYLKRGDKMQFNSYFFILGYFPALFIFYYLFNRIHITVGKIFLVIGSAFFYIYGGWDIASVLGISVLINYSFSVMISKVSKWKRFFMSMAVVANVFLLLYFKYVNFFCENISIAFGREYTIKQIILPLGISFFTFQQIMYVLSVYRSDMKNVNLLDYLVYILFFPKLIMGPLIEPMDLISQFNDKNRKNINWNNVSYGIKIFSFGLFKKLVLADTLSIAVAWGYSNIDVSTSMDWFIIMLCYSFVIYFDFSGYCDMAVGISKLLNIDLPINFDSPYKALSIRDFWKRWHISLTEFLKRYVYIPLGGNRRGRIRTYVNIMIVFIISGLWHGANWTFILWGGAHGFLNVLDRVFEKSKMKLHQVVNWSCTFLSVNILWLLFRSDSIGQWCDLILKMFTFQNMAVSDGLINCFVLPETSFLLRLLGLENVDTAVRGFSLLIFILVAYGICLIPDNNYRRIEKNSWITMVLAALAFVWSFLCLSSESVFVYFNF